MPIGEVPPQFGRPVPYEGLQKRLTCFRKPGVGEDPWTNWDGDAQEMSSAAFVAGLLVTQCSSTAYCKGTCPSRAMEGYVGWNPSLESPYSRPGEWQNVAPRPSRPSKRGHEAAASSSG